MEPAHQLRLVAEFRKEIRGFQVAPNDNQATFLMRTFSERRNLLEGQIESLTLTLPVANDDRHVLFEAMPTFLLNST